MKAYLYPEGGEKGKEDGGTGGQSGGCWQGGAGRRVQRRSLGRLVMLSCCPRRVHHPQAAKAVPAGIVFVHIRAVSSLGMFQGDWD